MHFTQVKVASWGNRGSGSSSQPVGKLVYSFISPVSLISKQKASGAALFVDAHCFVWEDFISLGLNVPPLPPKNNDDDFVSEWQKAV